MTESLPVLQYSGSVLRTRLAAGLSPAMRPILFVAQGILPVRRAQSRLLEPCAAFSSSSPDAESGRSLRLSPYASERTPSLRALRAELGHSSPFGFQLSTVNFPRLDLLYLLINDPHLINDPDRSVSKLVSKSIPNPSSGNAANLPTPAFDDPKHHLRIYQADCLDILAAIPENSVDLVFADPPYFLSNGGITCHAGKMVSVHKGDWDKSRGPDAITAVRNMLE